MTEKNKTGTIYIIKNEPNGKVYIGLTTQNYLKRFIQHKSDAKRGTKTHLHTAIRKYGIENFSISILESCDIKELGNKEQFYISQYNSTDSTMGYNHSIGGESGKLGTPSWAKGLTKDTSVSLKSISEKQTGKTNSFYGKTHSDENKANWSKNRRGMNHSCWGKKKPELAAKNADKAWTEEEKAKISAANSKPIMCVQNDIIYSSITKMCLELHLDDRSVYRVLKGEFKHTKGYTFKRIDKES